MRIALDVDGVLADVIQAWLTYNNKRRAPIKKGEITEWDFWRRFQINRYDFYKELSACWESWEEVPPTETQLSSATKNLSDLGTLDIVTAREKSTDTYVKKWLDSHQIEYKNYVSVIEGPKKAELDYDVFIDDSPINANKIINSGKTIFLYTQPWNLHLQGTQINRIDRLSQAIEKIKQIDQ